MELTEEQKQALEAQKEQCIFCKIIKGEVASKKVYEDDLVIAVLDINPATKGHTLVMPKEHYPILPLLPHTTFVRLFSRAQALSDAILKAVVTRGLNLFIANGAAAGQQSQHFMLHLIPRENGDTLDLFEVLSKEVTEKDIVSVQDMLAHNLPLMMGNHFKRNPAKWHDTRKDKLGTLPRKFTLEQVLAIIEKNPQIKAAMQEDPEGFVALSKQNDQLQLLFKDVSLNDVFTKLGIQLKKKKVKEAQIVKEEKRENTTLQQKSQKNNNIQESKKDDDVDLDSISDLL